MYCMFFILSIGHCRIFKLYFLYLALHLSLCKRTFRVCVVIRPPNLSQPTVHVGMFNTKSFQWPFAYYLASNIFVLKPERRQE
jgi:hypothetical protein